MKVALAISDVANAVLDGCDCVMLSGETAKGSYPLEAVRTMAGTCVLAESAICYPPLFNELRLLQTRPTETTETVASSAVSAAHEQDAGAIVVLSTSGESARLVSKYRPKANIVIVTRKESTARAIHLSRGCYPFIYTQPKVDDWQEDVDARLRWGMAQAIEHGLLRPGQSVIVIQGFRAGYGNTNTMRIVVA
ncbi:Pyruvate kinase [Haplosporangium sp. Z 27]|nr:Pyruvate kinase [Haplosporangium sp. Z 27]